MAGIIARKQWWGIIASDNGGDTVAGNNRGEIMHKVESASVPTNDSFKYIK